MSQTLQKRKKVKSTLEDFNLQVLLYIIKKSILWIVLFLAFTLFIAFLVQRYSQPIYNSSTELMKVTTKQTQILGVGDLLADEENEVLFELKLLKSKLLIERALDSLPLDLEYYAKGFFRSTEYYKNAPFEAKIDVNSSSIFNQNIYIEYTSEENYDIEYNIAGIEYNYSGEVLTDLDTEHFTLNLSSSSNSSNNSYYLVPKNFSDIVSEVSSNLIVIPSGKTIKLSYNHGNPEKAHDIIEATAKTFIVYDKEKKAESINGIIDFLDVQINNFGEEYYAFQDTLKRLRMESGFVEPSSQIGILLAKIEEVEGELVNIRFEKNILDWFKDYVIKNNALGAVSSLMFNESSHSFDKEIDEITNLEKEKQEKLLVVTPDHPDIILLNKQIGDLNNGLINQVDLALEKINEKQRKINQEISSFYAELYTLPDKETALSKLQRENEVKEQFYFNLVENKNKYLISKAGIVSDYIVIQKANIPKKPIAPNKDMIWLTGLTIGLLMGLTLIAIRYLLYQKITSSNEISDNTSTNVLGVIPKNRITLDQSQIVVVDSPKSSMSEAFRSIRSNMEFLTSENKSKLIATTSTVPGEGKTFVGINLAAIFSLLDKKVIILDFDLRKPRLAKIFDSNNQKGVSTILIGKNSIEECVINTGYKNLDFIPSGPIPPNPAELVIKKETKELIKELRQQYDYIFIDTPPTGLVTDAVDLLKLADYPLYVVRADYSERAYLENINKLMYDNNINNLSTVLNDFGKGASEGYGYGYGYGYGAGYYSDDVEIEKGLWFKIKKMFS